MTNLFRGSFFEDNSIFNGDIGYWDVRNVTEMDEMFRDVNLFNQDLSCWNVTLIETKPITFSTNSPLASQNMPKWGTDGSLDCTITGDSTDIQREDELSNISSEFENSEPEFSLSKLISRILESIVNFFNILN
ncbi:MAG: BspA family leucine-rich repeat surface protein [Candidatus Woesearchaeota archaeon]